MDMITSKLGVDGQNRHSAIVLNTLSFNEAFAQHVRICVLERRAMANIRILRALKNLEVSLVYKWALVPGGAAIIRQDLIMTVVF
jgi:hypothetical protein